MKILDGFISKFGHDKVMHFLGGYLLHYIISCYLTGKWAALVSENRSSKIGAVFVLILSVIKEILLDDEPDWKDIGAAMLGCLLVYASVSIGVLFNYLSM